MPLITLNRSPRGWAGMSPEAVCAGSEAQKLYCIRDAKADIATLVSEIQRLEQLVDLGADKLTGFMGRCLEAEAALRDAFDGRMDWRGHHTEALRLAGCTVDGGETNV